jgi:hypothetical protein
MKKQVSPAVTAIVIIVVVLIVAFLLWQFAGKTGTPKGGGEAAKFMKGAGMGGGKAAGGQPGQPGPGGPIAPEGKGGGGKGMGGQIMKQRPMGGG